METQESESCSSSAESSIIEEDRVALQISDNLKRFLEYDCQMITKHHKLVNLPAVKLPFSERHYNRALFQKKIILLQKITVVTILENFVKFYTIKSVCGPINGLDGPRRRNSSAKNEKREKDYEKLKTR